MSFCHSRRYSVVSEPILKWVLLGLSLWLGSVATCAVGRELDPGVMAAVRELVFYRSLPKDDILQRYAALDNNPDKDFAEREKQRLQLEHERKVQDQIRTRPDLKPYLMELLDSSRGNVGNVLRALAERDDLNHEDVEVVARTVANHLDNPVPYDDPTSKGALQHEYLVAAMAVLGRDLTPAHEELLLRALAWPNYTQVNCCAADVLTKAGVIRAIPALQAAIGRLKHYHDPEVRDIEKALAQLKEKIPPEAASPNVPAGQPARVPAPLPTVPPTRVPVERANLNWLWLLGIVVLIASIALLLKRYLKSNEEGNPRADITKRR